MSRLVAPTDGGRRLKRVSLAFAFALTVGLTLPLWAEATHTGFFHVGPTPGRVNVFPGRVNVFPGHVNVFIDCGPGRTLKILDATKFRLDHHRFIHHPSFRHNALHHQEFAHDRFPHRTFIHHGHGPVLILVCE